MNRWEKWKAVAQFFLLSGSSMFGFVYGYGIVWVQLGLPRTFWGMMFAATMGVMSFFGMHHWIIKDHDDTNSDQNGSK